MIKLTGVSKVYQTGEVKTHALKNVDLEINKGEVVVILGQSGSGKSTLLNCISGLDFPSSGKIEFEGKDISKYGLTTDEIEKVKGKEKKEKKLANKALGKFRRENIGFIFQNYNLFQGLNVAENVDLIKSIAEGDTLNTDEILDRVGLKAMKDKMPTQLSGGQQQRVSIARSVINNPKILFGDEPTGALDEESSIEVLKVIEKLNKEYGTTVVLITHNPSIALMADKVITVNSGEIVELKTNDVKKSAEELTW